MAENKNAKTPTDSGVGFIDGVWYGPGPTAWQCQCGKPYTVTCISSKPPKKQWVGLTDEEIETCTIKAERDYHRYRSSLGGQMLDQRDDLDWWVSRAIEAKLKEKNT
jgi:hypothetical protein